MFSVRECAETRVVKCCFVSSHAVGRRHRPGIQSYQMPQRQARDACEGCGPGERQPDFSRIACRLQFCHSHGPMQRRVDQCVFCGFTELGTTSEDGWVFVWCGQCRAKYAVEFAAPNGATTIHPITAPSFPVPDTLQPTEPAARSRAVRPIDCSSGITRGRMLNGGADWILLLAAAYLACYLMLRFVRTRRSRR